MNPENHTKSNNSLNFLLSKVSRIFNQAHESDFFLKVADTVSTRILLIFIGLTTSVIVARTLGPEGRGYFAMAVTLGALGIQFTNLGLHSSNTFYVARDPKLLAPLLGNSLVVSFFFGTLCALLVGFFFHFFPNLSPIQGPLLYLGLLWTPFGLAYLLLQNLLLGIDQVRSYNKIELGTKVFYVSLIGIIILLGWVSPTTIFSVAFLGLGFSLIWAFTKLQSTIQQRPSISLGLFNKSIRYGTKSYFGSLFAFLLFRIDLLMINHMLGPKETGLYDIAVNLAEMVYLVSDVVATMLFPKLCSIKEIPQKWKTAKNIGLWLIVTMLGICVIAGLMAYPAIQFLYGEPFLPSVLPFLVLILCKLFLSVNTIFSNFVGSIHVPWTSIPYTFSLVILNIFLNLIFINQFGIIGAAWASTISFGLLIPFNSFYSFKYLRSPNLQTS